MGTEDVREYGVRLQRSDALRLLADPSGPTTRTLRAWCETRRADGRPIAVDLFSGAGGLSAGLEAAGWSVAAAVDHDERALETHRHNFAGLALDLDLGDAASRDVFVELFDGTEVDLVAGGPPCQPFSRAGRSKIRSLVEAGLRSAVDERRQLWQAFLDVALRLKPRAVLMENVPDMALGDDFQVVRIMVERLEEAGYATDVRLVDAWRHGVPQHRKRLIVLARRDGGAFEWPTDQPYVTTLRDAIGDLPPLGSAMGSRELTYLDNTDAGSFARAMRIGARQGVLHDHMTRAVRPDDLVVFEMMDSSTLYSDIPAELRRYTADSFDDKYKRLDWNGLSRSITAHIAKDGYWYIHPEEHRTLTVREAARIQTFPDAFRFSGTRSDAFRQIGNAVPPLLGKAAAGALTPNAPMAAASSSWRQVRQVLARWARGQQTGRNWFMLPGIPMTPPVALAAAVLSSTRPKPDSTRESLSTIRGLARLSKADLEAALEPFHGTKSAAALERLRPLVPKQKVWLDPDLLADGAGLRPAERELFVLLQGGDVLLRSQGALRVASRVAGSQSSTTNRLTDGRIDLCRLVGGDEDAPLRMAALRLIGATVCTPVRTNCSDCPLSACCAARQESEDVLESVPA